MSINTLRKTNNKRLSVSSFVLLGGTMLTVATGEFVFSSLSFLSVPYIWLEIDKKNKLKNNNISPSFFSKSYSVDFSKNFINYVESSNSDFEKKYKILFSFLWLVNKTSLKNIVNELSPEYKKEKIILNQYKDILSQFNFEHLLKGNWSDFKNFVFLDNHITEDLSESNLSILKEIYKDFEKYGFIGENFLEDINSPIIKLILKIQEYKLSDDDVRALKNSNIQEKIKDLSYLDLLGQLQNNLYKNDRFIFISNKIAENNDVDKLNHLIDFYSILNIKNKFNDIITFYKVLIDKKHLENNLQPKISKPNPKVNKI